MAPRRVTTWNTLVAILLFGFSSACSAYPEAKQEVCDLYAAPGVSGPGDGSESRPYTSVQRLVDEVKPGETGCLEEGTHGDPDDNITFTSGGIGEDKRLTLQSAPGEVATIRARVHVPEGSDFVTVRGLVLDGSRSPQCSVGSTCRLLPSPVVNGDYAVFENNEVTNRNSAICFNLGTSGSVARRVTIKDNRIHHCGRLPATNHDHGIYLNRSRNARITGNWIHDNADKGIQFRLDSDGALVENNVIDGSGVGVLFSGGNGTTSDGNTLRHNVITFSTRGHDVESWYPEGTPPGEGNVVHGNCIYGGEKGRVDDSNGGFEAYDNRVQNPLYEDVASGDYTVRDGSCPNAQ